MSGRMKSRRLNPYINPAPEPKATIDVESEREPIDLTTASDVWIELEIPKGKRLPLLVATIIDASNGLIEYIDSVGLFTVDGRWKMRGTVKFNSGNLFKGTWTGFSVGKECRSRWSRII